MGVMLKSAPLIYVLSQLVINNTSHQKMEAYVSSFQEKLVEDYPDFREEQSFFIQLPPHGIPQQNDVVQNPPPPLAPIMTKRWHFLDIDGSNGFVLTENSLVFHTTAYKCFEDFLKQTITGILSLNEAVKIRFVDRIALRYVNAVPMSDSEDSILHSALRGMVESCSNDYEQAVSETVTKYKEDVTLVVRSIRRHKAMAFPADLLPVPMVLKDVKGESVLTLDLDCFSVKRSTFTPKILEESFAGLHSCIESAFQKAIDPAFFEEAGS